MHRILVAVACLDVLCDSPHAHVPQALVARAAMLPERWGICSLAAPEGGAACCLFSGRFSAAASFGPGSCCTDPGGSLLSPNCMGERIAAASGDSMRSCCRCSAPAQAPHPSNITILTLLVRCTCLARQSIVQVPLPTTHVRALPYDCSPWLLASRSTANLQVPSCNNLQ